MYSASPRPRLYQFALLSVLSLSSSIAACTYPADNIYDPNDGGAGGGNTGLPCDVSAVLSTHCQSCHGPSPSGAPIPLVTRDDLLKPSYVDQMANYAERSILRMLDADSPMPPGALPPASDVQVLKDWVSAGAPVGSCIPDPLTAAPVCTSGRSFAVGEGDDMEPGNACNACHQQTTDAPVFAFAGTVYATGHEPNDCYGGTDTAGNPLSGVEVWVTGADGQVWKAPVSSASGNFSREEIVLQMPYTAKVVWNGKERPMLTPQTNGDCNVCHTKDGAMGAPGRVTLPF